MTRTWDTLPGAVIESMQTLAQECMLPTVTAKPFALRKYAFYKYCLYTSSSAFDAGLAIAVGKDTLASIIQSPRVVYAKLEEARNSSDRGCCAISHAK